MPDQPDLSRYDHESTAMRAYKTLMDRDRRGDSPSSAPGPTGEIAFGD
jgi:hypothetical protein